MHKNYNNSYTFDLSMTNDCNFRCDYCVERGFYVSEYLKTNDINSICNKLILLYNDDYFKFLGIDSLNIGFWGGEPTVNWAGIEQVIDKLKSINTTYSLFTNGYLLDDYIINYIKHINETDSEFNIQISYDGEPLQSKRRHHRADENSAQKIRDNILNVFNAEIPFHLKSTVTFEDFKDLYEAYLDIKKLNESIGTYLNHSITLDYSLPTLESINENDLEKYRLDLEKNLLLIARDEIPRVLNGEKSIFTWFDIYDNNRKMCGAGHKYQSIDVDGSIYTCHGCLYADNKSDHFICNIIKDDLNDITDKLKNQNTLFNDVCDKKYDCEDCDALICYRCNSVKYITSNKESYKDRWLDFKQHTKLCNIYKTASNVYAMFLKVIKERQKNEVI